MKEPPWKVGELARNTGMTVRALHHYDEIGLLNPSLRSDAGHRLYDRSDIERLQRIHSLRQMGISLDEMKSLLDGSALSPRTIIDMQLDRLKRQIMLQQRLAARLRALARHMDNAEQPSLEELCAAMEQMMKFENYFTPEQLQVLEERRESVGDERRLEVEAAWAEIIPKVRAAMENGVDPTTPEILALAQRWMALVHEFTGGDPAVAGAVKKMYESEGPALQEKLGNVPTAEMFSYISRSCAALKNKAVDN